MNEKSGVPAYALVLCDDYLFPFIKGWNWRASNQHQYLTWDILSYLEKIVVGSPGETGAQAWIYTKLGLGETAFLPLFLCSKLIFGFIFSFHCWKFQERLEGLNFWVGRLSGKSVEGQAVSDVQPKSLICNFRAKSANLDVSSVEKPNSGRSENRMKAREKVPHNSGECSSGSSVFLSSWIQRLKF